MRMNCAGVSSATLTSCRSLVAIGLSVASSRHCFASIDPSKRTLSARWSASGAVSPTRITRTGASSE
jgi:hypothetical protein